MEYVTNLQGQTQPSSSKAAVRSSAEMDGKPVQPLELRERMKNHRKTIGNPWENGGLMEFNGIYPQVMTDSLRTGKSPISLMGSYSLFRLGHVQ